VGGSFDGHQIAEPPHRRTLRVSIHFDFAISVAHVTLTQFAVEK